MIIGLCGRMQNGKTELANVCVKKGYKRLYFALPLKQLCADILGVDIDELNRLKKENEKISLKINYSICGKISIRTGIPLSTVKDVCYKKEINTVREMLQFIGTDLIRKYNVDWHVNEISKMLEPGFDYVFDDVRFPNEKKMIEDLGGDCWFVTRPMIDNVSNHESETSIKWNQCWNRIIVNDGTLSSLIFKWETFIDDYEGSCAARDKEFDRILENGITDNIESLSVLDMLMLSKHIFTYSPRDFNKDEIDGMKMNKDNTLFLKYKNGSIEMIDNVLTIEDLKMFV